MNTEKQVLTLKELALNFVSILTNEKTVASIENYMHEMSRKSNLSLHDVKNIYNLLFTIYNNDIESQTIGLGKTWQSNEDEFIIMYINMYKNRLVKERKPLKDIINDLSEILIGRSSGGIGFRYYNVLNDSKDSVKSKPKKSKPSKPNNSTIAVRENTIKKKEKEKVVQATIVNVEEPKVELEEVVTPEIKEEPKVELEEVVTDTVAKEGEADLLSVVSQIVNNVEEAEVDISTLFKGLLTLSQKAVTSSNKPQLNLLKEQLASERLRNERLQNDYDKLKEDYSELKEEIIEFSKLSGKDKLKHFHTFDNNIKKHIVVDGNGLVVEVKEGVGV